MTTFLAVLLSPLPFRKELLEKLGLDSTWFLSLFIVGVSLWSATVLVIALFVTYRTYIYCRVEDLTEQAFHHQHT